jgi:hypothetical protein
VKPGKGAATRSHPRFISRRTTQLTPTQYPKYRNFLTHEGNLVMTDSQIAPFLHDEISDAGDELTRARYRLHAASMIAISRLVTATFPTARELVVDCALRTLDPVGPTLVAIVNGAGAALFHDDTQPYTAGEGEPELTHVIDEVHRLLGDATGVADLATLGWAEHRGEQWCHQLAATPLLSGAWTFLRDVVEPGSDWRCFYAQADCARCHGRGHRSTSEPLILCHCVITFF